MNFFPLDIVLNSSVLYDPIEQFELFCMDYFLLSTDMLLLLVNTLIILILFYNLGKINVLGWLMDSLFTFYKKLFFSLFYKKEEQMYFFPFFFIFIFILINNIMGLFPYTYTLTSLFTVTFFTAFIVVGGITFIGFEQRGWQFFARFFPSGVPTLILLLLVCLEAISYIVRLFSLSLRLFANMLSGHLLLKMLLSFLWIGLFASPVSSMFLLNLGFWLLLMIIFILEIVIAFLQAYVFVFLSLIYLREVLN